MPDGGCLGWYRSATRLDPVNGEKVGLVQGPQSPTGGLVAGIDGQDLVLWGRDQAQVIRLPLAVPDLRGGAVAWAPDGTALVYLA